MSAAERKAMAEAKRQRWLQEQRDKQRALAAVTPLQPTSAAQLLAGHRSASSSASLPTLRWLG